MFVSNSEIQTFKRCKRKWYLSYYRKLALRREPFSGPRSIGNRIHGCVAQYYEDQIVKDSREAAYDALQLHDWAVAIDMAKCETDDERGELEKDASLSRIMLEGYFEWLEESGADEGLEVVAAEQPVSIEIQVPVNGTSVPVTLAAKLDLRIRKDGVDMLLDHKTVQEFTTPTRTLHLDEQMLLYDWMVWALSGYTDRPHGAIYNMLRKVKRSARANPPFFARFEVQHSEEEIRSFAKRTLGVLADMINVRRVLDDGADPLSVVYPTPTRDCSWQCDFFPVCPLVDRPDIGGGQTLLEQLYVATDPYERYGLAGQSEENAV